MHLIPADSTDDTVRVTRGPKAGDFEPEDGKSRTTSFNQFVVYFAPTEFIFLHHTKNVCQGRGIRSNETPRTPGF